MDNKHTIILIFISLTTLVVMIIGASYAYFASSIDASDSATVGALTPAPTAAFITASSGDINIDVSNDKMQQTNANDNITSDDLTARAQLSVYLSAAEDQKVSTCSYNVIFEWGENSAEYVRTQNVEKEFTISSRVLSVDNVPSLSVNDPNYHLFKIDTPKLEEINFDELTWQTRTITEGKGANAIAKQIRYANLIEGAKVSSLNKDTPTIVNLEFQVKFYNANRDQSAQQRKNFSGAIKVDNSSINC